jgi:transcriptional regulator with XRE-family HTH domain
MGEQVGPNVGPKLRTLRERQGLSIRALAQQCGLSINAISQIERGDHSPTVSSLHMLANALRVPISAFFEDESEQSVVLVKQNDRLRSQAEGVLTESLGIGLQNQQLEPFFVTVEPGAGNIRQPITHLGEEFVYCVEGNIEYRVNDAVYQLETGDSLLFEAIYPHSFHNAFQAPATLVMVFHASRHFFRASGHIDLLSF